MNLVELSADGGGGDQTQSLKEGANQTKKFFDGMMFLFMYCYTVLQPYCTVNLCFCTFITNREKKSSLFMLNISKLFY